MHYQIFKYITTKAVKGALLPLTSNMSKSDNAPKSNQRTSPDSQRQETEKLKLSEW